MRPRWKTYKLKMNGMIHIAIFWCRALNYIYSKEALQEAKVECLEANVKCLESKAKCLESKAKYFESKAKCLEADVERLEAEAEYLKAAVELLAAKTNRYDWFCTFEYDYICS